MDTVTLLTTPSNQQSKKTNRGAWPVKRRSRKRRLAPLSEEERKLVEDHLDIAKFAAWTAIRETRGYTGCLSYEDLVGVAHYALCVASRDFDPSKGFLFSTYASRKAQGYIQHALRDHSRLVRIPRSVFRERASVRELMRQGFSAKDIADKLGIPLARVVECENSWKEIHASLDQPPGADDEGMDLSNLIPSYTEDVVTAVKRSILHDISSLPEGTVDLLNRYYYEGRCGLSEWEIKFCENFFELYKGKLKENGWN